MSLRGAVATWQSPAQSNQIATTSMKPRNDNESAACNDSECCREEIATASMKPRNDNESVPRHDSEKTAVHDEVRYRRHLT